MRATFVCSLLVAIGVAATLGWLLPWAAVLALVPAAVASYAFQNLARRNVDLTAQLRATEERYRLILDTVPYGIRESNLDGRIEYSNPAHDQLLGYEPGSLVGQPVWIAVADEADIEWRKRLIEQIRIDPPEPEAYEARVQRKDGAIIQTQVDWNYKRDAAGQPIGFVSVITDITKRRQLEDQLRHSQKMDALGQLAGGISHDFNNLLTAIQGFNEQILKRSDEDSAVRGSAREIQKAASTASAVIDQMLTFSRRRVTSPSVVDVNEVVSEMERMLRRVIGEDITLRTFAGEGLWPVLADSSQLSQVILNLVLNARDALVGAGGEIRIRTANHQVGGKEFVVFSVEDDGEGMSAETIQHVFEPFFTTKEPGRGSGLGLATVYGIVAQAGGHIDVDSTPGEGTKMRVALPRCTVGTVAVSDATPRDLEHPEDLRGSETILLVEDDDAVRRLATEILEEEGYRVLSAGDGDAALAVVAEHEGELDLLLTDVVLPGLRGPKLAATIREQVSGLRVVYLSGYAAEELDRLDVGAEHAGFLAKPFKARELLEKVREVLGANR